MTLGVGKKDWLAGNTKSVSEQKYAKFRNVDRRSCGDGLPVGGERSWSSAAVNLSMTHRSTTFGAKPSIMELAMDASAWLVAQSEN